MIRACSTERCIVSLLHASVVGAKKWDNGGSVKVVSISIIAELSFLCGWAEQGQ